MTIAKAPNPKKHLKTSARQVFFCLMSLFCLLLILRNSEAAIEYMGRGLTLCAHTVIPALFPFMVISELLVHSGAGEALGRLLAKPMRWLFGLSGAGCSAIVLGSMCGFPVGASTAVSLYDKNVISKAECEHLLTFSNNPSSGFLITAVGASLLGNRKLGLILYLVVLGSSFVIGFFMRFYFRGKNGQRAAEHKHFPSGLHPGGVETFTGAVSHSATGMLTVCAYVIFFSTLTGVLSCVAEGMGMMNRELYTVVAGFFEMSGGISEAASLVGETHNPLLPLVLTAAIAGWSGLSVHCQVMTLCGGRGLSFKPYLMAKGLQGILSGLATWVILTFIDPASLPPLSETVALLLPSFSAMGYTSSLLTFFSYTGLIFGVARRILQGYQERR